jgi:Icc-related predicted phosphoesterase
MRVVAVADTHGHERALGPLPEGDLFVHAGDLLRDGSVDELLAVAAWLHDLPFLTKIVVAGNSDWCFLRDPEAARRVLGSDVIYLQDQSATIEGLTVWGSPWQPEYRAGAFNLPRGKPLAEKWGMVPLETAVLITHGPPRGFGDQTPAGRIGCDDLLSTIRRVRPALHLFGHAHGDGGVWYDDGLCLANVTTAAGRRGPTVLDIDTVSGTVTDVSVPASEAS